MPLVSLSTNAKFDSEDAKRTFVTNFSKFCAKTLDKDEASLNLDVSFNPYHMFGGTFDPAFMLSIRSIGNVNPANTDIWSSQFSAYFESELGVPVGRGLMSFTDPGPGFVGWGNSSVQTLQEQSKGK